MNKQTKNNIMNSKKVSAAEYRMSEKKTYVVSKSDEKHTAYVVKCESYNDIPLVLSGAKYEDTNILSARVVEDNNQLESFVASGNFDVEAVEIPAGANRENFLKKWAKAATKKKSNLLPLLLLPLTACGGNEDVTSPVVTEKTTGIFELGSDTGEATLSTDGTNYTFTPATGLSVEALVTEVTEIQVPVGVVMNSDAADISGQAVTG